MIAALLLSTLVAERPYVGPEVVEVPGPVAIDDTAIDVHEPRGRLAALAWAPDGRSLWVAAGATLYRVQADTGQVSGRIEIPDGGAVDALAISPNGRHLAAITDYSHLTVWESATGKVTLRAGNPRWMLDEFVAFSPDGKQVFAPSFSANSRGDEIIRIEAWSVASGRSLGKKRMHEVSLGSDSAFEFVPIRLAGHHVYFDDIVLLVRPREIRPCDDELPYAATGELGWYGRAGVRRLDDCKLVRAGASALDRIGAFDVQLSVRGDRATYARQDGDDVTLGVVDLVADAEAAHVEYGDVAATPGFAAAPDGSQVAAALVHRDPDGNQQQFLLVWRPFASPARMLALRVPEY